MLGDAVVPSIFMIAKELGVLTLLILLLWGKVLRTQVGDALRHEFI